MESSYNHEAKSMNSDYFLFSIWLSSKLSKKCIDKVKSLEHIKFLLELFDCIDKKNWDKAKTIWLVDICKKKTKAKKKKKFAPKLWNFGNEYSQLLKYFFENKSFDCKEKIINHFCSNEKTKL